jgi:hypothetical protein
MDSANTCIARINSSELADLPPDWSTAERGCYLRLLLRIKGIDAGRWYRVEFFPRSRCWLLTQERAEMRCEDSASVPAPDDASFFVQAYTVLRRTARSAYATAAARSMHFARHGCEHSLPPEPEKLSAADIIALLGPANSDPDVHFDSEGGWICTN